MAGQWYYTRNGQQTGPVTEEQLRQLAHAGQIQPTDFVWTDGMANWAPAGQTASLFPTGAPAPPPSGEVQ